MELYELRQQVLALPDADRARLARELIDSLCDSAENEEGGLALSPAWLEEIVARSDALRRGELEGDDWRTSLARVEQLLADRKSS